jgi:hypothetical protein
VGEREQRAALALQAAGDPHGESLRQTLAQAESYVALFFEACPVDGPTYCGTYRVQLPIAPGSYPVYKNQHGRVLYRNTIKHMWVIIDGEKYAPGTAFFLFAGVAHTVALVSFCCAHCASGCITRQISRMIRSYRGHKRPTRCCLPL